MKSRVRSNEWVPTLSGKEAHIFELLLQKPTAETYGLALVNSSRGRLKRGTVYVTLTRMEDKGFVQSRQEEPRPGTAGLPRRLYRPTGYGQKVYEAWQIAKEARQLLATEGSL